MSFCALRTLNAVDYAFDNLLLYSCWVGMLMIWWRLLVITYELPFHSVRPSSLHLGRPINLLGNFIMNPITRSAF